MNPVIRVEERTPSDPPHCLPILLRPAEAAALCGKSLRTWRSWDAAGLIPRPVRIGRSTLWRSEEMRAWVAAGCPRRKEWQSRQALANSA
ncbi:MAG: helix-turn-helix transcriptional regulator [Pirellulales bacterium]